MTSHAVDRLHHDIKKLKGAEHTRDHEAHKLHKDAHAEKHEHNVAGREHDRFDESKKAFSKEHDALGKLKNAEKKKLSGMDTQLTALQQQYDDNEAKLPPRSFLRAGCGEDAGLVEEPPG